MVESGDIVRWKSRFGNNVVGEVEEVTDGDLCSTKADYCLRPDDGETALGIEHYPSEDGVRDGTHADGETTVHYERNVVTLDCESKEDMLECEGPEDTYQVRPD